MIFSKSAVKDFRVWFATLKLNLSVTKAGIVRKNISYKNKTKISDSFIEFLYYLVDKYVRPVDKSTEKIDVTQIWIPHYMIEALNTLLESVKRMWIFYTPEDIDRYPEELDDKDVVIFGDNVIISKWER